MKNLFFVALMLLTFTLTAQTKIEVGETTYTTYKYKNHTKYVHTNDTVTVVYNHGGKLFVDKYGYPAFRFEKFVDGEKEVFIVFYGPVDKYWMELYDCTNTSLLWNTYTNDFKRKTAIDWIGKQSVMRSYIKDYVQIVHPNQFDQLISTYNVYNFKHNSVRSSYLLPQMPR